MKYPRLFSAFYSQPWAVIPAEHRLWGQILNAYISQPSSGPLPGAAQKMAASAPRGLQPSGIPGVSIIPVHGVIGKHLSAMELDCTDGCDLTVINSAIDLALQSQVKAVVFDFDSPGGTCTGIVETADKIASLSDAGIETYAWTESQMCSAAMWLASACDEIHASPSSVIGSIGVYCALIDDSRYWDKEGIAFEYFISDNAPLKGAGAPGRPITDAMRDEAKSSVDAWTERFHAQIKKRRKMASAEWFTGGVWNAEDAPDGMVDSSMVATLSDFLKILSLDPR